MKLFFEMTEAEVQLQNILNNLEYAHYQVAAGINGYGNGIMTEEEREETESSVNKSFRGGYERCKEINRRACISGRRAKLLPEMATEEIMQINAESMEQYEAFQRAFLLGNGKVKINKPTAKIIEHPVYGSGDMEGLRRCVLIDLEDCMTKDRETGEKGEALCMTFQNEEGKYINVSYLDGQLSMSSPYRK